MRVSVTGIVSTDASNRLGVLRLVLQGATGVYTIVNGTRIDMMPGEVLLTPAFCWHGHANETGETGYWLVTRQVCAEVGGGAYPGLLARMRNGRVSALVARSSVCD